MKKLVATLIAGALALSLSACGKPMTEETIKEQGVIVKLCRESGGKARSYSEADGSLQVTCWYYDK